MFLISHIVRLHMHVQCAFLFVISGKEQIELLLQEIEEDSTLTLKQLA